MRTMKTLALVIVLLAIIAQLYVPISMASRYENILETGTSYRFTVVPRDPADPFKGRYVRLTFPVDSGIISDLDNPDEVSKIERKNTVYAVLDKGSDNVARIRAIKSELPKEGDYIKVKVRSRYSNRYTIELPFNRYYAEESKAPKIEELIWNRDQFENRNFYADVRVKDGHGVIAELYIEDIPILEYLIINQ